MLGRAVGLWLSSPMWGPYNWASGIEALYCGHFGPSIPRRTSSQVGGPLTRQWEGATAQQGHGLCSAPDSLVPAHWTPQQLGVGVLGDCTKPGDSLSPGLLCGLENCCLQCPIHHISWLSVTFHFSSERYKSTGQRRLDSSRCAPNVYSIMNYWVNSKSEGMEINICIAS